MCYINIVCSLLAIFIDFAIFLVKKSTHKSGSHYTILKQLLMANLIESSYLVTRDAIFLSNDNEDIYFNTIWLESIQCNILNVTFFLGLL